MEPRKQIFTLLAEGVTPNKIELHLDTGEKTTLQRYINVAQLHWLFNGNELVAKYIQAVQVIPETIMVNGFEVPAPMAEAPNREEFYYVSNTAHMAYSQCFTWNDGNYDFAVLSRKIAHKTRENAVAHAKAMLGIDPTK